jgi:hypothetical protein
MCRACIGYGGCIMQQCCSMLAVTSTVVPPQCGTRVHLGLAAYLFALLKSPDALVACMVYGLIGNMTTNCV